MIYHPHEYQTRALQWVLEHPRCGLFLDMGLGKTVVTLTAVRSLIDDAEVEKVLVVAPKKVAETTWTQESAKWEHLKALRVAKVMGSAQQRERALQTDADVYVIGRDSFTWLVGHYNGTLPFDMLVIDELTTFKSSKSQRFKAMRLVAPKIGRVVGLTGTPAPNGLIDLWAQMYCLDMGQRLGKFVTRYRDTYFNTRTWNNIVVKCQPKKGAEKIIRNKISDICLSMRAKDYLQLPGMMVHRVPVELSPEMMKKYDEFERENALSFLEEHTGEEENIIANSAAGLMNKLSQYANGAIYDGEGNVHEVHGEKLERLAEIIEAANGAHVLVFYQYRHDIERIKKRLKGYVVKQYVGAPQLDEWNAGKIDVLLAHPASTAFGLNMQQGGHYIVWFGTGWNLELYEQANARLYRQGQIYPVTVYQLVCAGTVDEQAASALERKSSVQEALLDGLKGIIRKMGLTNE